MRPPMVMENLVVGTGSTGPESELETLVTDWLVTGLRWSEVTWVVIWVDCSVVCCVVWLVTEGMELLEVGLELLEVGLELLEVGLEVLLEAGLLLELVFEEDEALELLGATEEEGLGATLDEGTGVWEEEAGSSSNLQPARASKGAESTNTRKNKDFFMFFSLFGFANNYTRLLSA